MCPLWPSKSSLVHFFREISEWSVLNASARIMWNLLKKKLFSAERRERENYRIFSSSRISIKESRSIQIGSAILFGGRRLFLESQGGKLQDLKKKHLACNLLLCFAELFQTRESYPRQKEIIPGREERKLRDPFSKEVSYAAYKRVKRNYYSS